MARSPKDPKRRFYRLLGRGARAPSSGSGREVVEETALWSAHGRASVAVRDAGESAQRIASHAAKQRGTVDALAERSRAVAGRAQDLAASFGRVVDSFGRLELVALNAGLEGARLGETAGQALVLVSDEVRVHATRGAEASRELAASLGEIGGELAQVHASLDRARDAASDVAQEAARAGGAASDAERALTDIGERLKRATGTDPETVRAIAEASEHARALVHALSTLTGNVSHAVVLAAVRPVLEPLLGLLAPEDERA